MVRKIQRTKPTNWDTESIYAVGYVRGRNANDLRGVTVREQERQIRDYAEENGYELIRIITETNADNMGFMDAKRLCRKKEADLLYVDMGNWNANPSLKRKLAYLHNDKLHKGAKGIFYRIRPVAITADEQTMDAVHREARVEKFYRWDTDKMRRFRGPPRPPYYEWKVAHGIGDRRFKNFLHLTDGVRSIHYVLGQNPDMPHVDMAKYLDRQKYLTVDNKRWTKDNVRKTRGLIEEPAFKEFAKMRKKAEERKTAEAQKKGLE